MSRASTAKPPALAMPSRRAAVSAGFPVRRRRPDLATAAIRANTRGACPPDRLPFFMLFSSFPCCQKAAPSLSMDCAARAAGVQGRAGEEPWRERPRRQGQPRGERCRMVRQAAARSCRPLWSGKSHVAQARRHRPSCCGWTGKRSTAGPWRERSSPYGWRMASPVRCRHATGCPLAERQAAEV